LWQPILAQLRIFGIEDAFVDISWPFPTINGAPTQIT